MSLRLVAPPKPVDDSRVRAPPLRVDPLARSGGSGLYSHTEDVFVECMLVVSITRR